MMIKTKLDAGGTSTKQGFYDYILLAIQFMAPAIMIYSFFSKGKAVVRKVAESVSGKRKKKYEDDEVEIELGTTNFQFPKTEKDSRGKKSGVIVGALEQRYIKTGQELAKKLEAGSDEEADFDEKFFTGSKKTGRNTAGPRPSHLYTANPMARKPNTNGRDVQNKGEALREEGGVVGVGVGVSDDDNEFDDGTYHPDFDQKYYTNKKTGRSTWTEPQIRNIIVGGGGGGLQNNGEGLLASREEGGGIGTQL